MSFEDFLAERGPMKMDEPAYDAASVTPHDTNDLSGGVARALYVGTTGDVEVIMAGGTTVVFSSVPAGYILPIRVSRVKAANTTASDILALY